MRGPHEADVDRGGGGLIGGRRRAEQQGVAGLDPRMVTSRTEVSSLTAVTEPPEVSSADALPRSSVSTRAATLPSASRKTTVTPAWGTPGRTREDLGMDDATGGGVGGWLRRRRDRPGTVDGRGIDVRGGIVEALDLATAGERGSGRRDPVQATHGRASTAQTCAPTLAKSGAPARCSNLG
jgi:hypothetical protein